MNKIKENNNEKENIYRLVDWFLNYWMYDASSYTRELKELVESMYKLDKRKEPVTKRILELLKIENEYALSPYHQNFRKNLIQQINKIYG